MTRRRDGVESRFSRNGFQVAEAHPRPKPSLYGEPGATDFRRTWFDVTAARVRVFATISTDDEECRVVLNTGAGGWPGSSSLWLWRRRRRRYPPPRRRSDPVLPRSSHVHPPAGGLQQRMNPRRHVRPESSPRGQGQSPPLHRFGSGGGGRGPHTPVDPASGH